MSANPDTMPKDFLYQKAPLIEVIAEIHWSLKNIQTLPNAKVDPYFDLFKENFVQRSKEAGLQILQELIPKGVPAELLPNQAFIRLRPEDGKWPLCQIGPGVATANIVPPYNGWAAFEPFLHGVIDRLFIAYPLAEKTLQIERLHLRYIDGFDDTFGMTNFAEFCSTELGLSVPFPSRFFEMNAINESDVWYIFDSQFPNVSPEGSMGKLKISPGQKNT